MASRERWLRSAVRASIASVTFGAVVGVGALVAGLTARSLSLVGFAIDSVIDCLASILLVHRFHVESINGSSATGLEQRALRVISWLLLLAGLYVGEEAVRAMASTVRPETTAVGIGIAATSVLILPGLAYWKRRLSRLLGSRALRADSLLTAFAAILAAITLVGVLLGDLLNTGRADAVAALAIAIVLLIEGVRGARESA
jgi:divalent metal cation (Fe/Co/Zn/Cd) transporter